MIENTGPHATLNISDLPASVQEALTLIADHMSAPNLLKVRRIACEALGISEDDSLSTIAQVDALAAQHRYVKQQKAQLVSDLLSRSTELAEKTRVISQLRREIGELRTEVLHLRSGQGAITKDEVDELRARLDSQVSANVTLEDQLRRAENVSRQYIALNKALAEQVEALQPPF